MPETVSESSFFFIPIRLSWLKNMLFLSVAKPEIPCGPYGVELRLDLMENVDVKRIADLVHQAPAVIMLTVRKPSQGGKFAGNESERKTLIETLLALKPAFFDLEEEMDPAFLQNYPNTKCIVSYHNFQGVPEDLEVIYDRMQKYGAFGYKLAVKVYSTVEALKMLIFAKTHSNVSAICMGEAGEFARVLGPVVGNQVHYACATPEEKTAPGQLTVRELTEIYHFSSLNQQTSIYGLIGNPVVHSVGHLHHNGVFRKRNVNAVYVKMALEEKELAEFFVLAKKIGIKGLSVTAPLKEKVLPFLDETTWEARQIGAVNTLLFRDGKIYGTNTDGMGALDAIEKRGAVKGKIVVLLGAGGAARAIAFEAKRRGAEVLILNRTMVRAEAVAADLGCQAAEAMPFMYDIVVNCASGPVGIEIKEGTLAMDVVYHPKETEFLKMALSRGCQIVYGEEMFLNQAAYQTAYWLND